MNKTDNRHYNNTKSNRNLHLEINLWIKFIDNNKKPIVIWKASDGYNDYELTYDGNSDRPYRMCGELGDFNHTFDTIEKAKRCLKNWNHRAKAIKK